MNHYLDNVYHSIKRRCYNPEDIGYKGYGGRGIKIYQPWVEDRRSFRQWVTDNIGDRPSKYHSLDRIDNDGNYEPGNLRWATWIEQNSNRRSNKWVEYKGVRMTQSECARLLRLSRQRIHQLSKKKSNSLGIVFLTN